MKILKYNKIKKFNTIYLKNKILVHIYLWYIKTFNIKINLFKFIFGDIDGRLSCVSEKEIKVEINI